MKFTQEQLEEMGLSIIPFTSVILSATKTHVYLRERYEDENHTEQHCILYVKRSHFNKMIKLWLDRKAEYYKNWKEFCGVFGNFQIEKIKFVGEGFLMDFEGDENTPEKDWKYIKLTVPIFEVISFDKHCDMEHG